MLIYDLEIKKCIPPYKGLPKEEFEYCKGWHDHAGMGVSSIVVYDYEEQRYRIFMDDNMEEFSTLLNNVVQAERWIIGFNNIQFDNQVLNANGLLHMPLEDLERWSYDILQEIWMAVTNTYGEIVRQFDFRVHAGYGLDAMCKANGIGEKTGHGAIAPEDFQNGNYGRLLDYNLNDVHITKELFDLVWSRHNVFDSPKGGILSLRDHPAVNECRGYY